MSVYLSFHSFIFIISFFFLIFFSLFLSFFFLCSCFLLSFQKLVIFGFFSLCFISSVLVFTYLYIQLIDMDIISLQRFIGRVFIAKPAAPTVRSTLPKFVPGKTETSTTKASGEKTTANFVIPYPFK